MLKLEKEEELLEIMNMYSIKEIDVKGVYDEISKMAKGSYLGVIDIAANLLWLMQDCDENLFKRYTTEAEELLKKRRLNKHENRNQGG